jgi:hypothetical protein
MSQDNSKLSQKLELRRHFLERYHREGELRVFDAFQARGIIWTTLAKEFPLTNYWGVDVLEKKGRIRIESSRILAQAGWRENILDLDAYGSPWTHWLHALRKAAHSLTIFLTLGSLKGIKKRCLTAVELRVMGIPFKLPRAISGNLSQRNLEWMLAQAWERFSIVEAIEALPHETARYFGLRLELKP